MFSNMEICYYNKKNYSSQPVLLFKPGFAVTQSVLLYQNSF